MTISFKKALNKIEKEYEHSDEIHKKFRERPDKEYLQIFTVIQREWNRKKTLPNSEALRAFAYAGCLNFSRWYLPTPYTLPDTQDDSFSRFLGLLKRTGSHADNIAPLELQKIKSDIFNKFHLQSLVSINDDITEHLDEFEKKTHSITTPIHQKKSTEVAESKKEIFSLTSAIRTQSVSSVIKTTLPFPISKRKVEIDFTWKNLEVRVELFSRFQTSDNMLFGVDVDKNHEAIVVNSMPSKWQYGRTKVSILLPCLADHSVSSPPLTWLSQQPASEHRWPSTYSIAFDILERVCWYLNTHDEGFNQYLLNPSDLSCVEHSVIADRRKIFSIKKDHPGAVYNLVVREKKSEAVLRVEEKSLSYPVHSQRCRRKAENYLAAGETNNAIIWLNIAFEALIKERIEIFSILCGQPSLKKEAYLDIDRFEEAREIVEKQYPDLASKVKWPKSEYSPSVWKVIKRLSGLVGLHIDMGMLSAQYRNIQKHRGTAVHGEDLGMVSASAVKEALESYDWIDRLFILSK